MDTEFTLWDGNYEKTFYLAKIGEEIVPCWPNAGLMCATDKSGRTWEPKDNIQVRICTWDEYIAAHK